MRNGSGPHIAVLSRSHIGSRMASPGIRAFHMARVLVERVPGARVSLATRVGGELDSSALPFRVVPWDAARSLASTVRDADIVVSTRLPLSLVPLLLGKRVVLDLYTPYLTEMLEIAGLERRPGRRRLFLTIQEQDLAAQLLLADYILCASKRQRDLYFGMLCSLGRITTDVYDEDHTLNNIMGIAPYGVRPGEPAPTRRVLRGVHPGIEEDDTVLIWNGTIIEWYDTETLIRAVHRLSQERSDIKLFFLGTEHPDSAWAAKLHGLGGGSQRDAVRLAGELGVLDRQVFFNFDWVDYDETASYLAESDIGVCTYFENLETRYAFRTRFVDLLWAELPIVCTRGDVLAERVAKAPLGIAIGERDEDALVDAIRRLADDKQFAARCKANLREEKDLYRWERTLEPLVQYCSRPAPASMRKAGRLPALAATLAANAGARARHAIYKRFDPY
jgi:glycosyltransferase involved in cell wall biosynthesis